MLNTKFIIVDTSVHGDVFSRSGLPKSIIFNVQFIIFDAKFTICDAKFTNFDAKFTNFNAKSIIVNRRTYLVGRWNRNDDVADLEIHHHSV